LSSLLPKLGEFVYKDYILQNDARYDIRQLTPSLNAVYSEALSKKRLGKVPVEEVITKFDWRLSVNHHLKRGHNDSQVVCRPI